MANRVTVSAVGRSSVGSGGRRGQAAVDYANELLKSEIAHVLPDKPDLIVLPEACDRFPDMDMTERKAYYACREDQVRDYLGRIARDNHCYIAYSAARLTDDGSYRNSTQIIDRQGDVAGIYNKNFPVIGETTNGGILCGKDAPIIQCDFGKVACAICFDIVFDEMRRNYADLPPPERPDIICFSSMMYGGLPRLQYWAFSSHAYLVTACTNGRTLKNHVVSPEGVVIASTSQHYNHVSATINLDNELIFLDNNWGKLQEARRKYGTKVKVQDNGCTGAVLLSSETDEFTVKDIIAEFEIETFDSYKARHRAHRANPANVETS